MRFVEEKFEPALDDIYRQFLPMLQFYTQPKCFVQTQLLYDRHRSWFFAQFRKYSRGLRIWMDERGNHINDSKVDKYIAFQSACDEYQSRMNGQDFHGGDAPDAVDFKVFSQVYRYGKTLTMRNLFA